MSSSKGSLICCHYCGQAIISKKDLIAVGQYYPHFPFALYHNACYSDFLKSGKVRIGPLGMVIYNGQQARIGKVVAIVFFLVFVSILVLAVRPSMPHTFFSDAIYYFLLAVGVLTPVHIFALMSYVKRIEG